MLCIGCLSAAGEGDEGCHACLPLKCSPAATAMCARTDGSGSGPDDNDIQHIPPIPQTVPARTVNTENKRVKPCMSRRAQPYYEWRRLAANPCKNEIAGAGLDVYEKEPLPENNKLRFLPNALLTPHIGYVTAENYSIFYTQMIEALESCVSGNPVREIK